jgi:hypothetical protein
VKQNNILEQIFKGIGVNVKDPNNGFFVLQGVVLGIALNDIWRIFQLPGENKPIIIGNSAQSFEVDFVYQLAIGVLLITAQLFGLKYGSGLGAGVILGSTLANTSETGQTISVLPFKMDAKK